MMNCLLCCTRLMLQHGMCMTSAIVPVREEECPLLWLPTGSNPAGRGRRADGLVSARWSLCWAGLLIHSLWMEITHHAWSTTSHTGCHLLPRQSGTTLMAQLISSPCLTGLLSVSSWLTTACGLGRLRIWIYACCSSGFIQSTTSLPSLWWRVAGLLMAIPRQRMLSTCITSNVS